jgi:PAS domain S-box-containing protein
VVERKPYELPDRCIFLNRVFPGPHNARAGVSETVMPADDPMGDLREEPSLHSDISLPRRSESLAERTTASERSEALFFTLAETVPAAILIVRGSRILYANPYVLAHTGYSMEEVLRMNFWDFVHPDFRNTVMELGLARQRGEVVPSRHEIKVINKNGGKGWFDSAATIMDYQGQPAMLITGMDITGRKRMEEDLRASEKKFSRSFKANPNPVTITSVKDGRYIDVNDSFLTATGYGRQEVIGRTSLELNIWTDPSDRDRLISALREKGSVRNQEFRFRMKSGEVRVFLLSAESIDIGDEPCLLLTTTDITDRKLAESALFDSEQRLQAMLDNSPTAIYLKDQSSRYALVNRYFENHYHISRARIIGKTDHDLLPLEFAEQIRANDLKVFESGKPMEFEEVVPLGDALRTYISIKFPLYDSRSQVYAVCGISTDITDRKRAEEALRESEEKYRRFFEEDLSADYIAAPDGRLLACNPAFARMFGFGSIAETAGCNLRSLYADVSDWEEFARRIRVEKKLAYHEAELRRLDGLRVNAVENAAGTFDHRGELVEIRGYLFDNTDHKKLENQLLQSRKMEAVGMLAGGVAHDFNNLLTGILGYSQLILRRLSALDPMRREIEEIERASAQAASLTNQLLAFSRQQMLQPRVIDLNDVITENTRMLRRIIGEDIELVTVLAPDLGCVRADPVQIQQVILNLAVNARDAMPHGGKLAIETANFLADEEYLRAQMGAQAAPQVMMSVSDTGQGMDEETQLHIFDPFFTTKEKGRGTGLGLSTVYGIIHQSGGHVSVESQVRRGTTFRILLPRVYEPVDRGPTQMVGVEMPGGRETILLVEDSKVIRDMAGETLRLCGYTVVEASGSGEALLMCEGKDIGIDLMLTDVVMPLMSGPELAQRLTRERADMKVLFMSGYTDNEMARHGILERDVNFIQKPFTPSLLSHKIREVLDR